MKTVRIKVLRDTQERADPWVNTSMVVNFMFNPAPAPTLAGQKRNLQLLVQAQRSLNTDARDASASLALRVYCTERCERVREGELRQPLRR